MIRKAKCPKCGKRSIDIRYYKDGSRFFVHAQKIVNLPGIFPVNETEGCMIPNGKGEWLYSKAFKRNVFVPEKEEAK